MGKGPGQGSPEKPKRHYCREHQLECKAVMVMPGKRMVWTCPSGCTLQRGATVLK